MRSAGDFEPNGGRAEADFTAAVERLTGLKVVAFISGDHIDPDVAAETFILDSPLTNNRVITPDA